MIRVDFQRTFNFGRVPYLTLALVLLLVTAYYLWQGGPLDTPDAMIRAGGKSRSLMLELGQWWRLFTANFLHASGLHLLANCFFLFNLGGPAEAVFRRLDYALIVVASALGASTVSAAASSVVSCGASGIVFGVWGAVAVFGIRYRDVIPERYQRFFIGAVIPYALFTLYLGLVTTGVDNWSHLGGLLAGSAVSSILPARLVAPRHDAVAAKLAAMSLVLLGMAGASAAPLGVGALLEPPHGARHGLYVPMPGRWTMIHARSHGERDTFAYANEAGVTLGVDTERHERPVDVDAVAADFLGGELPAHLERAGATARPLGPAERLVLAGLPARRLRFHVEGDTHPVRADFVLATRGYFRYVVSLSAPLHLWDDYRHVFAALLDAIELADPEDLGLARRRLREAPDDVGLQLAVAAALARAGEVDRALDRARTAARKFPDDGRPLELETELLVLHGREADRACYTALRMLDRGSWTAARVGIAVDALEGCDNQARAAAVLSAGLARFPSDAALIDRRDRWRP